MDLITAISQRRSVREYSNAGIDQTTIRYLIDAAIAAPNAMNQQPWAFTVVRDQVVLEQISREAKAHLLASTPEGSQTDHFRSMLASPDFQIFYHAPVMILISGVGANRWLIEDCALAAENLMLAACGAGLGSCWIGFAQSYLGTSEGKRLLGLPAACTPVAPIIVGHPRELTAPVPRREPDIRWIG